jgi:cell division protein FtsW
MARAYQIIALCVLSLLSIGVVMVTSASQEIAPRRGSQASQTAQAALAQAEPLLPVTPTEPAAASSPDAASEDAGAPATEARLWSPARESLARRAPVKELSILDVLTTPQATFMGVALLAMALAAFLPVRRLAEQFCPSVPRVSPESNDPWRGLGLFALGCVVLVGVLGLVYMTGIGKSAKGAERWIRVPVPGMGQVSVQPSEIAKWALVGLVAWYATRRAELMPRFWIGLVPALVGIGGLAALIIKEDLGTGALIGAVASLVLIAGGARVWHFLLLSPIAAAGVYFAVASSAYRRNRILAFLDPYADPQGIGYHSIQSIAAVSGGGIWGRGLGAGLQKFGYLPEDTNDFIFGIICEELGVPGAAMVIALFAALIWAGWTVASRENNRLLKLFALGVVTTVALQALINMAVVTALGPTKGIALPLVSSGGTGWTLTALSLGLVISIGRTQPHTLAVHEISPEQDERPPRGVAHA